MFMIVCALTVTRFYTWKRKETGRKTRNPTEYFQMKRAAIIKSE
jgi:hypothetical protein